MHGTVRDDVHGGLCFVAGGEGCFAAVQVGFGHVAGQDERDRAVCLFRCTAALDQGVGSVMPFLVLLRWSRREAHPWLGMRGGSELATGRDTGRLAGGVFTHA